MLYMKRIIIYVLFAVCAGTLFAGNFVLPDKKMPQHPRLLLLQEDERSLVQFIQGDFYMEFVSRAYFTGL